MKRSELFFSFILLPVDAAMIIATFVVAYWIRIKTNFLPVNSDVSFHEYISYIAYILPFWLVIFGLNGLYRISRERNYFNDFYKIFISNAVVILLFIVTIFFGRAFFFSRLILILILFLSVFFVFFGRVIVTQTRRYLYRFGYGVHRIVIIGNNKVAFELAREIMLVKRLGMKFIGLVNGLDRKSINSSDLRVIGKIEDLQQIIKKHHPDELILTDVGINRNLIFEIIQECADANVGFKFVSDIFSIVTSSVNSSILGGFPVMELKTIALDGWGRIVKRLFDIVCSLILLILTSPIMALAALAVKLTSKGPIIYKQQRIGRDGKTFEFYKIRSMFFETCDLSKSGTKWSTERDLRNRITPIGKFLRKTSIDEFPQFFNVLKGDMSFVGPRPELPKFVNQFQKEIPEYFRRHRVKSGITGWAQVNGLKGDTSIKERVRFDIFYIENWSFWYDIKIIIKTAVLVIGEAFGGKYEYRSRP